MSFLLFFQELLLAQVEEQEFSLHTLLNIHSFTYSSSLQYFGVVNALVIFLIYFCVKYITWRPNDAPFKKVWESLI